jgi:hypothetical protein
VVDLFTGRPPTSNPVVVVFDTDGPDTEAMQVIAISTNTADRSRYGCGKIRLVTSDRIKELLRADYVASQNRRDASGTRGQDGRFRLSTGPGLAVSIADPFSWS